jgi:endonuclease G
MASRPPYVIPYDPKFLGDEFTVSLPQTCCKGKLVQSGTVFDYIHYSLVMHQDRRSALYTAHNIDYSQKTRARGGSWDVDDRMNTSYQTDNHAYRNNPWDRGHLVRRDAVVWGSQQEAQDASDSTYFYTNAALQHGSFNQSGNKWLGLENWILHKAGSFANRLCVFTGPIYTDVDVKTDRDYTVPSAFFKVVVLKDPTSGGTDLSAVAFLMKQNDNWRSAGARALTNLQPYHVSIAEIEAYTGLDFGEIGDLDEFDWRQVRFTNRALMPAIPINGPEDIEFNGNKRRATGMRATRTFVSGQLPAKDSQVAISRSKKDCGCKENNMELEQEVKALKKQTTALCEILECLMEDNNGNFDERSLAPLRTMVSRIVGGQIVQPGEYLECVALGDNLDFFCSGVLVHPRVVLTAAHCADISITRVLLNARQVTDRNADIIEVEDVIVHPDYYEARAPWNDIAVIILKEEAPVVPIEIASKAEVLADDSLILVGFGSDDPNGIAGFGTKRRVDVSLTLHDDSEDLLANQREHGFDADFEFHGGRVNSGMDTCRGDSGGPAYIITQGGELKVAGLTSRAANSSIAVCGDGGIYTMIDAYANWLFEVTDGRVGSQVVENGDAPPTQSGGLYISAVTPNPEGTDSGNEWVEITNNDNKIRSLAEYSIEDRQARGRHALTGNIAAGDTLRVVFPTDSPVKLGNNGDDIKLLKGDDLVHEVSYTNAASGRVFLFDPPAGIPVDEEEIEEEEEEKDPCEGCGESSPCDQPVDHQFTPGAIRC